MQVHPYLSGALGAEREAGARVTCRQPCEEFLGVLTEIQGLRLVTSNLLEDLQKVVRAPWGATRFCGFHMLSCIQTHTVVQSQVVCGSVSMSACLFVCVRVHVCLCACACLSVCVRA